MCILSNMIDRDLTPKLTHAARTWPAVTLTGPRQSGKTTLCRKTFADHPYASLEVPDTRAFATEDPRAFLGQFPRGAVLDEIQRVPDLLSYLQGIIDDDPAPGRWILTGSHNLALLESVSQSLAGRTAVYNLFPLTRGEVLRFPQYPETLEETLFTGSYPRIFDSELNAADWLRSYVATYVERDVRLIRNIGDLSTFQRFVALCAGRTAQLVNYASLAGDCGISQPTAKSWLGILEAGFLVFRLPAYRSNLRKRLVKMPKLHFYDTGLVCFLLGIRTPEQLLTHPLRGAVFETWVVSEIVKRNANGGLAMDLSFYRDRNGAEVDLVVERQPGPVLVEVKSSHTASPRLLDGAKRVRGHFSSTTGSFPAVAVHGGDSNKRLGADNLVSWQELHRHDWEQIDGVITVRAAGRPVAGADVLALFPNTTWKAGTTDANGTASLVLHSARHPMTVYVAAAGYAAHRTRSWIPSGGPLDVELDQLPDGGAAVFQKGTGHLPILQGRLNPILDPNGHPILYADNIAIDGGTKPQPASFTFGSDLHLADSDGQEAHVRVVDMVGRAALLEYRRG